MLVSENIVKLYNKILDDDMFQFNISQSDIRTGIISMAKVYSPKDEKDFDRSIVADFNDAAHRCAYLHKYAPLHTAMVRDFMFSAIRENYSFFCDLLFSEFDFKICSLGGGPGSDVIGVLSSLVETFNHRNDFNFSATVIDYMTEWRKSFKSVIKELTSGTYGKNAGWLLQWRYMGANLLKSFDPEVKREIYSASLITAVKFISAASCKDTEFMVKNIFSAMKPGAVLFFIDNAGGGFKEFILDAAIKYNFIPIYGPVVKNYINKVVKVRRFGTVSCHNTRVSVAILQKPREIEPRLRITVFNTHDNLFDGSGECRKGLKNCDLNPSSGSSTSVSDTPLDADGLKGEDDRACAAVQRSPLTPYVFQLDDAFTPNPRDIAGPASHSDNRHHPVSTPDTPRRGTSRVPDRKGCAPMPKFSRWRHHLSTKLNSFKSRIQNKCGKGGK